MAGKRDYRDRIAQAMNGQDEPDGDEMGGGEGDFDPRQQSFTNTWLNKRLDERMGDSDGPYEGVNPMDVYHRQMSERIPHMMTEPGYEDQFRTSTPRGGAQGRGQDGGEGDQGPPMPTGGASRRSRGGARVPAWAQGGGNPRIRAELAQMAQENGIQIGDDDQWMLELADKVPTDSVLSYIDQYKMRTPNVSRAGRPEWGGRSKPWVQD